jgi:hypothetical protein
LGGYRIFVGCFLLPADDYGKKGRVISIGIQPNTVFGF